MRTLPLFLVPAFQCIHGIHRIHGGGPPTGSARHLPVLPCLPCDPWTYSIFLSLSRTIPVNLRAERELGCTGVFCNSYGGNLLLVPSHDYRPPEPEESGTNLRSHCACFCLFHPISFSLLQNVQPLGAARQRRNSAVWLA